MRPASSLSANGSNGRRCAHAHASRPDASVTRWRRRSASSTCCTPWSTRWRTHGCAEAAQLVPYLKELGVTDVYISPPFAATPGSTHGYDVVDHNTLRAELGGPEGYDALCRAIADAGMGQLVDFVPNHMGIGPSN